MSSWSEERRLNLAAEAAEQRKDDDARDERRRKEQQSADQRRRDLRRQDREERRVEKGRKRRDRAQRRQTRVARREKALTPGNIYRRGTLALVTASALASLPAQIFHFAGISRALLPIPFALEGAAWVMAAGVAYADEKKLAPWVRWLLRILAIGAACYAASINYGYGVTLSGLTPDQAHTAGLGLAAVTAGGPLLFEIRQWVTTLAASTLSPKLKADAKARQKHDRGRKRDHKDIVKLADRLISAAPFGTLSHEEAFRTAWEIHTGIRQPGMTPALHRQAVQARRSLAASLAQAAPEAGETKELSPEAVAVELFLAECFGPGEGDGGTPLGAPSGGPLGGPQGIAGDERHDDSAGASEGRFSLGRKGERGIGRRAPKTPERPLSDADLAKVRDLAVTLGGASNLSHSVVKKAVGGGSNEYLVRLRKAIQTEGGAAQ